MARILLVDDSRPVLDVVRRILSAAGHEVLPAANGAEGLRLWKEGNVDLVVSDLRLPDMNGGQLARQVRDDAAHVPIVLVSGEVVAANEAVEALHTTGVYALGKPFSTGDLLTLVTAALERAGGA